VIFEHTFELSLVCPADLQPSLFGVILLCDFTSHSLCAMQHFASAQLEASLSVVS
jgi:hypothetical protein